MCLEDPTPRGQGTLFGQGCGWLGARWHLGLVVALPLAVGAAQSGTEPSSARPAQSLSLLGSPTSQSVSVKFSLTESWDRCILDSLFSSSVLGFCAVGSLCCVCLQKQCHGVVLKSWIKQRYVLVLMQNDESRVAKCNHENSQIQTNVYKPAFH